jgi:hypothetical protein
MSDKPEDWAKKQFDQQFYLDAQITDKEHRGEGMQRACNALGDIAEFIQKDAIPEDLKHYTHYVSAVVHVYIHPLELTGARFVSHTALSEAAKANPRLAEWMLDKGTERMRKDIQRSFGRKAATKRSGF